MAMGGDDGHGRTLAGADAALSGALAGAAGAALDLRDLTEAQFLLRGALVDAFAALRRAAMAGLDAEARAEALEMRLASLEADVYLLKTAVPAGAAADVAGVRRDPLALAAALAAEADPAAPARSWPASLDLPFDAATLGAGWSGPRIDPDGVPRRWTAPGGRASVVLPAPWRGACVVEAEARFSDGAGPDAAAGLLRVESPGSGACALSAVPAGAGGLRLRIEAAPSAERRAGFLFLDFDLQGASPPRALGLSRFVVSPSPAASAPEADAAR